MSQWHNLKTLSLMFFEFQTFFWSLFDPPQKVATISLHDQSIYFLIYEPTDDFNDFVAGNTLIFLNFVISLYE